MPYDCTVIGAAHYQRNLNKICGRRKPDGERKEIVAQLVLDNANRYDTKAVRVDILGLTVGYLGRDNARIYRMRKPRKTANIDALIVGGWDRGRRDRGDYEVRLDLNLGFDGKLDDEPDQPADGYQPFDAPRWGFLTRAAKRGLVLLVVGVISAIGYVAFINIKSGVKPPIQRTAPTPNDSGAPTEQAQPSQTLPVEKPAIDKRATDKPATDQGAAAQPPSAKPATEPSAPKERLTEKPAREMRTWNSADGKFQVRAKFSRLDGVNVVIEREDGQLKQVPLGKLSKDDQDWVEKNK